MAESLHLIVIGAGLCGLAAAIATKVANPDHRVTILESVKELAEIGVSILSFTRNQIILRIVDIVPNFLRRQGYN